MLQSSCLIVALYGWNVSCNLTIKFILNFGRLKIKGLSHGFICQDKNVMQVMSGKRLSENFSIALN